ncbi:MAG: sortase [Firmicutes bacterium]|nr:sortase [Bacillota bacterium]
MKRRKRSRILWLLAALLLFAGAGGLTARNLAQEKNAAAQSQQAMEVLAEQLAELPAVTVRTLDEQRLHGPAQDDGEEDLQPSAVQQPSADSDEAPQQKAPEPVERTYIGVLSVPSLHLQLPVQESWSYADLKATPCRLQGSPQQQDLVILAHNYKSHFGRLKELVQGDEVSFTSMDGVTYVYYVDCLETVEPQQVAKVTGGDWPLTLFTCTPGGLTRLVVYCTMQAQ